MERLQYGQCVVQRLDVVGADVVDASQRGMQFGGQGGRPDVGYVASGECAEKGLPRRRDQHAQPEPFMKSTDGAQHLDGGFWVGAQEEAEPRVDDEPLARDTRRLEYGDPTGEEVLDARPDGGRGLCGPGWRCRGVGSSA